MQAIQMGLAGINVLAYAQDDLRKRFECVPSGMQRIKMAVGGVKSVLNDVIGTITHKQAKHIWNTMQDMEMRLVPKLTTATTSVVMEKETLKTLIDCSREKCHGCVEDGDSCRKCELYEILTVLVPLEEYGDFICPYSLAEWEE